MKLQNGKVVFESDEDLLPIAMSLHTTSWNQTGSWKYLEPYYQDQTPPCVDACMVGNDIVTFMRLIDEGRYEEAALGILEHNPFPATLGRVCPHPCESPCNRKKLGGPIAIQYAERFLGDYAIAQNLLPALPKMEAPAVTVVGAGPAGLSAAYFLRKLGHHVTVIEAETKLGGLLWSGIPTFRLGRTSLDRELERFRRMDIQFRLGERLGKDVSIESLLSESQAVLLAIGLGSSRELGIEGEQYCIDGIQMLKQIHSGKKPGLGRSVAVIGGGNTAVDCARSLIRLGHDVTIVYRRTATEMPAFPEEISEAMEEGVHFEFLTTPSRVVMENGVICGIECIRMKLGEVDASNRPRPIPIEDSQFLLRVDAIIKALGETLHGDLLPSALHDDSFVRTTEYQTAIPNVFACGDCVGKGGTVAQAIAMGREAAYAVHAHLLGEVFQPPNLLQRRDAGKAIAQYEEFNTEYFQAQNGPPDNLRRVEERLHDFSEVRAGLSEQEIRSEANRCFKCGTCNLCGNCSIFCPDGAIVRSADGSGYEVRYQYCKGCMVCVEECPRGAIHQRRLEV